MRRIFVPGKGLGDWQALLADPERHWKRGRSAFELAVSWEAVADSNRGLPVKVAALLDQKSTTAGATLLLALPEHKVKVPGQGYPSQSDVWALLKNTNGLISIAIEGKAGESFDKTVAEWLATSKSYTTNKHQRLNGLCQILNLPVNATDDLRYQLLHRAASAALRAQDFGAAQAAVVIQSFGDAAVGFSDFHAFALRLGATSVQRGQLVSVRPAGGVNLFLGWLDCPFATDADIARTAGGAGAP